VSIGLLDEPRLVLGLVAGEDGERSEPPAAGRGGGAAGARPAAARGGEAAALKAWRTCSPPGSCRVAVGGREYPRSVVAAYPYTSGLRANYALMGVGTDLSKTIRAAGVGTDLSKTIRAAGLGADLAKTIRAAGLGADLAKTIRAAGLATDIIAPHGGALELGDAPDAELLDDETVWWLSWVVEQPALDQLNLLILFLQAVAHLTRLMLVLHGEQLPEQLTAATDAAFALVAFQLGLLYMRYGRK